MKNIFKKIKLLLLTLIFSLAFSPSYSYAQDYKFIGKHLLEYSIFKIDIYEISYFKASSGPEKLILDYKTNVKKKYSQEGWKVGLKYKMSNPKYTEKAKWLLENTIDLAKGDKLSIVKDKTKVSLYKNDKLVATIDDPIVAELAFEPWLGEKPVSMELKNSLLGLNKGE